MRPWDRVRVGTARCAKSDRCGDEKTAGGAVCTRLKVRGAGWDMTPRLLSSTIDGGTNVRPEFLAAL